jgi:hypothetical protein
MKLEFGNFHKKKRITLIGVSGSSNRLHVLRDWIMGLVVATVVFVGGAGYIAFDFYMQFGIESNEAEVKADVSYDSRKVNIYAEKFNERERVYNKLRTESENSSKEAVPEETKGSDTSLAPESVETDTGLAEAVIAE